MIASVVDRYLAGVENKSQWAFLCRAIHTELVGTAQEMHITFMSLEVQPLVFIHWGYFHGIVTMNAELASTNLLFPEDYKVKFLGISVHNILSN